MGNETTVIMVLGVCKFINLLYDACVLCVIVFRWCICTGHIGQCPVGAVLCTLWILKQDNCGNTVACVTEGHGVTLNPVWGVGKLLPIK